MDAPTYPPAAAFEQPLARSHVLSLEDFSLAELMSVPAAWEIVVKNFPPISRMVSSQMIQPHLNNFTIQSVVQFLGGITTEKRAAINEELRKLPPFEGGSL